jgi:hypothetical protein
VLGAAADLAILPLVCFSGLLLWALRRRGIFKFPRCKSALLKIGVFPISNHYYEPQFDYRKNGRPMSQERPLPGIDWNIGGQLELLKNFGFSHELQSVPRTKPDTLEYYVENVLFGPGDAEYWYQLIRATKPRKIFEVGSGHSTLVAIKALTKNREQDSARTCRHVCIEPYESPWLEETGVEVMRRKIEDVDASFFAELEENDILFIDSSHMIRPQGDVLFEYLELLPTLKKGVIVHIHDIFSPSNYPKEWLEHKVRFWNEQYLVEAFLSHNKSWKVIGALNYLRHHHYDRLKEVAPFLEPEREPGSLYIQRID